MTKDKPMSNFWLISWAAVLSIGWLLPNHYAPWSTFHMDAWVAIIFLIAAFFIIAHRRECVEIHGITILTSALATLPFLQFSLGILNYSGTAWIATAYLVGFFLCIIVGGYWEKASTGQMMDGLFAAIIIASILSVGLQLHQWLSLDLLGIWSMGGGHIRPFANFGQPNNLATFLIWGLLATAWQLSRQRIGRATALVLSFYMLFGIALTMSRTACLGIIILLLFSWHWRNLWADRRTPWVTLALGVYFLICLLSINAINQFFSGNLSTPFIANNIIRTSDELRFIVWPLFFDALLQKPWLGYGWTQVSLAHLTAANQHPSAGILFSHAHNLLLDLFLWCGIPIGALISIAIFQWLRLRLIVINNHENAIIFLTIIAVGNHAMLELPLHHAYFLLPTGLMIGALNVRTSAKIYINFNRTIFFGIYAIAAILLALIIRDYLKVESTYQKLRFEWAGITTSNSKTQPDLLLLDQWHDFFLLEKFEPTNNMSTNELARMERLVELYPSAGFIHKYAVALAINQRPTEANIWLKKMCKITPASQCLAVKRAWANDALINKSIASVSWPE